MTLDFPSFKAWLSLARQRGDTLKEPGFWDDCGSIRKPGGGYREFISQPPLE